MARQTEKLCVLSIGIDSYVMPLADGTKIIALMAYAVEVERDYGSSVNRWIAKPEAPRLSLTAAKPKDIVTPDASRARGVILLEHKGGA